MSEQHEYLVTGICLPAPPTDPTYDGPYFREDEMPRVMKEYTGLDVKVNHSGENVGKIVNMYRGPNREVICDLKLDLRTEAGRKARDRVAKGDLKMLSVGLEAEVLRDRSAYTAFRLHEISLVEQGAEKDAHIIGQGMKGQYFMVDGRKAIPKGHTSKRTSVPKKMDATATTTAAAVAQPETDEFVQVSKKELESRLFELRQFKEQHHQQLAEEKKGYLKQLQELFDGSTNFTLPADLDTKVTNLQQTPGGKEWLGIICGVARDNHDLRTNLAQQQKEHDAVKAAIKERDIFGKPTLERSAAPVKVSSSSGGLGDFKSIGDMMAAARRGPTTTVLSQNSAAPPAEPTIAQQVEIDMNELRAGAKKLHFDPMY